MHFPRVAGVTVLIWVFYLGAAAEQVLPPYLDMAQREIMPPDDLERLIHRWDSIRPHSLFETPVGSVSTQVKFPDDSFHFILRYRNDEIVTRVVDLYIAEHQRFLALMIHSAEEALSAGEGTPSQQAAWAKNMEHDRKCLNALIGRYGKRFNDEHLIERRGEGEAELEYHDLLIPVAESTFSKEIHDCVIRSPFYSSLREMYLAFVRPDETIDSLLEAQLGIRDGERVSAFDSLFFADCCGSMSTVQAMTFVHTFVALNEDVANRRRDLLVSLVKQYALVYSKPVPAATGIAKSFHGIRFTANDYDTRVLALQILSKIGGADEVRLVREIATVAPVPDQSTLEGDSEGKTIDQLAGEVELILKSRDEQR